MVEILKQKYPETYKNFQQYLKVKEIQEESLDKSQFISEAIAFLKALKYEIEVDVVKYNRADLSQIIVSTAHFKMKFKNDTETIHVINNDNKRFFVSAEDLIIKCFEIEEN
jgi:hypothetical protein